MAKLVFGTNQSLDGYVDHMAFAATRRNQSKWVASHSLKAVDPDATRSEEDLEDAIRGLKAELDGEIEVTGPDLSHSLSRLGLIDEYRIYRKPSSLVTASHISPNPERRYV